MNGGNADCTCFNKVAAPLGSRSNPLEPYVSIGNYSCSTTINQSILIDIIIFLAANDIAFGTKVLVKQLQGVTLPSKNKK